MIRRSTGGATRAALLSLVALVGGCSFGPITGVASLSSTAVAGLLAVNNDGSIVYAGEVTSGTPWDANLTLKAFDTSTGSLLASVSTTGSWKTRGVSADPDSSAIFTLHENGTLVEWDEELGYVGLTADFFDEDQVRDTYAYLDHRYCDMEKGPDGLWMVTGALTDGSETFTYVTVQVAGSSGWETDHLVFADTTTGDFDKACARVSFDTIDGYLTVLQPRALGEIPAVTVLSPTWSSSGVSLGTAGTHYITQDSKLPWHTDITALDGKFIVAADATASIGDDALYIYDSATGSSEDSAGLRDAKAVAMPKDPLVHYDLGDAHSWFSGYDAASGDEVGWIDLNY